MANCGNTIGRAVNVPVTSSVLYGRYSRRSFGEGSGCGTGHFILSPCELYRQPLVSSTLPALTENVVGQKDPVFALSLDTGSYREVI